ncbi:methylamine utilization protein [Roseateles violae]|uniref:Methylamine utilization protein n=1 Tax=Roseateles violae TaxID=3058042 RepID=A0ABT8DP43_9BURK|nr:methylamine utilization protein [Pelomonas sp. PFR6]MDN3918810.1 methylamine utilization protein [Pelomonas sp. PFR6]
MPPHRSTAFRIPATLRRGLPALLSLLAGASLPAQALPWTLQLRNAAGQPLADTAVAVEIAGKPSRTGSAKAQMDQRERQFAPRLLIVQTGTAVNFPNFDTVRHHVYSFSPTKVFETKLYSGTPAEPIVFDKPGVAALGCNIHDRMSAHIVVVDTPVFARSDAAGIVRFDLPPGEHQLKIWHAGMKAPSLQSQALTVTAGGSGQSSVVVGD